MAAHPKVHELLDRAELDALEAFAREPARTVDQCHDWMLAKGYTISRSAVGRWKKGFDGEDGIRAATEVARQMLAASGKGTDEIADAANLTLAQTVFEQALRLQRKSVVKTKDLFGLSLALKNTVATKRGVEQVREEMAARQKTAAEEARKVADAGGSAAQVVAVIQKAFGIGA